MRYALPVLAIIVACGLWGCDNCETPSGPADAATPAKKLTVSDEHRQQAAKEITPENAAQKLDEIDKVLNQPMPKVGQ